MEVRVLFWAPLARQARVQIGFRWKAWALLKGVAISTFLGIGTQLSVGGTQQGDLLSAIRQSTQDSLNQAGQQITQKNLNIQPTIKVRPGWPLRVIVHKDLVLRPYRG